MKWFAWERSVSVFMPPICALRYDGTLAVFTKAASRRSMRKLNEPGMSTLA
jgi:hypothetical protein